MVGPLQESLHRGQEIILNGAAQTAIGELHQTVIQLIVGAEATTPQEIAINPHLPKFIHHHGKPLATGQQQVAQEGGFAGPQKARHHRDR